MVNGIDVSKWQGEMDWQKAKAAGAQFAIIRAGSVDNTSGICYEDVQFKRNAEAAPLAMEVGFYWYFRPNHNAITQADYFIRLIRGWDGVIYPTVDVEEFGAKSKAEVMSAVWSFANRVFQQMGVRPMIYTSPGFWNSRVARNTWAKDHPLWVAHWGVDKPVTPNDWRGYGFKFWQTHVGTDGAAFGAQSREIDHDVYNGDWDQFAKEFGLVNPSPVEEISGELTIEGKTYIIRGQRKEI